MEGGNRKIRYGRRKEVREEKLGGKDRKPDIFLLFFLLLQSESGGKTVERRNEGGTKVVMIE